MIATTVDSHNLFRFNMLLYPPPLLVISQAPGQVTPGGIAHLIAYSIQRGRPASIQEVLNFTWSGILHVSYH